MADEDVRRGCRYISRLVREDGWAVNYKRVHRLWKQEGYKVPKRRRKKRAIGHDANACDKLCGHRPQRCVDVGLRP